MNKCDKLLEKAINSTNNFSFSELCQLAECYKFQYQRQSGSHVIYENQNLRIDQNRLMNFQNFKGKAKSYQVKQLLKAIAVIQEKMNNKYTLQMFWSEEDEGYIAICQEFPGFSVFGETREEALREAQIALDLMIETYQQKHIPLPKPQTVLLAA
jgi:predicted RNase H-like HicB family nuclease